MKEVFLRLRYPEDVQLISQAMGALHAQVDDLAARANEQIHEQLARARSRSPEASGLQNGHTEAPGAPNGASDRTSNPVESPRGA